MLAVFLAAALSASPSACPADLLVSNPRVKATLGATKDADVYVVTVDVKNRGVAAQPADTRQHLEVVHQGQVLGSQPIPVLGADQTYAAAFRVTLPHANGAAAPRVEFHYVLDSKNAPRANCTTVNDKITATLR
ncbi:MAG TPA: hypothetical protein VFB22_07175 [Candidatus Baltobacteraceae bacterium]|nr:hypothetical protein [Candidatus Baltobacteraceae bacterium]